MFSRAQSLYLSALKKASKLKIKVVSVSGSNIEIDLKVAIVNRRTKSFNELGDIDNLKHVFLVSSQTLNDFKLRKNDQVEFQGENFSIYKVIPQYILGTLVSYEIEVIE